MVHFLPLIGSPKYAGSVKEIIDLGDIEKKFETFGWYVARCDGHDFSALDDVFANFKKIKDKPKILIADTIKGKGISFMEGPTALKEGNGLYKWHSGAPDDDSFHAGYEEILNRLNNHLNGFGLEPISLEFIEKRDKGRIRHIDNRQCRRIKGSTRPNYLWGRCTAYYRRGIRDKRL